MTSISVLSAVVFRVKLYLQDDSKHSDSWRNEAQELLSGLERINQQLKDADRDIKQSKKFIDLEKQIVQLFYDIDDAIAGSEMNFPARPRGRITGILAGANEKSSKADLGSLRTNLQQIHEILKSEIQAAATAAANKIEQTKISDDSPPETSNQADPTVTGEDSAGMEDGIKATLLKDDLSVVCIWGESGMGKSTLAKKAYYHDKVRKRFELFGWVSINHDFQTKKVLQDVLLQLLSDRKPEIWAMDEIELTLEIFKVTTEKKCLVVFEGIRDPQDWRSIRVAFSIDDSGSSGSKILITTTSRTLAEEAASVNGIYEMKPLTEAQCLKILKEKANFDDQAELDTVGKTIFSLSGGSPLIAIILGKSFRTRDVAARNQLLQELRSYLNKNPIPEGTTQVLGLSYDRLPHELKPCLLYMGQFPIGKNIEADKLYLLLAAEDFVLPEDSGKGKTIYMESLRNMLEKLALKKLVGAEEDKVSKTRMFKSCRLHGQIRDFCISKGQEEEFFEIVDFKSGAKLKPSTRRLAVYMSKYEDGDEIPFNSDDTMKKIRSLLIFDTYDSKENSWPEEINDLKEFSHLRVLDFDGVDFRGRKLPRGIDKLVLLRYLSFRECYLETLPSAISKFPCLETLDLRVNAGCKMTIPNVFSNLNRLRHLYFPVVYESDGNGKLQLHGLEMLEILVNFDTGACNINDLFHFHNLQILTTTSEGKHNELDGIIKYLEDKAANSLQQSSLDIRNFDCYSRNRTTVFRKLLACKSIHSLHIEGQIGDDSLKNVEISSNFTEMVFNGSELEDDPMTVLGKLEDLRSLTLCNDAFVGTEMTISAASKFPELRILKLLNLQYLEKLTFEKGVMPKLSTLVINKCGDLEEVVMSKALDNRLRLAQGKKGDDVYFVEPPPKITNDDNKSGNPASAP